MTEFSPANAAFEGLRVMRREPKAVLYWIIVWALALILVAIIKYLGGAPAQRGGRDFVGLIRSFGPLATILVPTLLVLWVMNTATVYRAVLRPGEHGWHLFKLGPDEARIAVLSALETALLVPLGGVPAFLLLVLLNPIFLAAPSLNWVIAVVGFIATVFLEFWIAVRFSLAPVQTFAEKGFPLDAFWGFTRGRSWTLMVSYLLVFLEIAVFLLLAGFIGLAVRALAASMHGLLLLALVPVIAGLSAALFVVPSTLICACQAYAYRAIAGPPVVLSRPT